MTQSARETSLLTAWKGVARVLRWDYYSINVIDYDYKWNVCLQSYMSSKQLLTSLKSGLFWNKKRLLKDNAEIKMETTSLRYLLA